MTEDVGKNLQKAGCAGMSTGCVLTLLSPLIIIALLLLVPLAVGAAPVALGFLVLLLPAIGITRIKYGKLEEEYPDKGERWRQASKQSWKPALVFYGTATLAVVGLSLLVPESGVSDAAVSSLSASADEELGTWRVTYQGVNITTTIRREQDAYYLEQYLVFQGNGDRIEERLTKRGDRYYLNSTEYFVIDTGYLEAYDSSGFIWAAR